MEKHKKNRLHMLLVVEEEAMWGWSTPGWRGSDFRYGIKKLHERGTPCIGSTTVTKYSPMFLPSECTDCGLKDNSGLLQPET